MIDKELREIREAARNIADMYLQKFPRPLTFGVELNSGKIISIRKHLFSEEEVATMRDCSKMTKPEFFFTIINAMEREGHKDLVRKIFSLTGAIAMVIFLKR